MTRIDIKTFVYGQESLITNSGSINNFGFFSSLFSIRSSSELNANLPISYFGCATVVMLGLYCFAKLISSNPIT